MWMPRQSCSFGNGQVIKKGPGHAERFLCADAKIKTQTEEVAVTKQTIRGVIYTCPKDKVDSCLQPHSLDGEGVAFSR